MLRAVNLVAGVTDFAPGHKNTYQIESSLKRSNGEPVRGYTSLQYEGSTGREDGCTF